MDPTDDDGTAASPDGGPPVRLVTVNDVVSMNLGEFRKAAGLSQQDLANRIGWLKSVVATAERSWAGRRSRNFTVGDLIDIASGLGIPVAALLLPPEDDGIAVTYMVDGLHAGGPRPLRDLLPLAMADSYAYDGQSAAAQEFRRRLLALGYRQQNHVSRADVDESGDNAWTAFEALRSVAEHAVAAASGDQAAALQAEQEMARRLLASARLAEPDLMAFRAEADAIEARVKDLRAFEREYRSRLRQYMEDQYRVFWAGTESVDPEQLLSVMRDEAAGRPRVITVPDTVSPPALPSWDELPQEVRELAFAGMQDLRKRGISGPYAMTVEDDGALTVMSAVSGISVRVEKEAPDEGERLPAVFLP
jgi:transcriptional regulator with XRE-family HTH domain